MNTIKVTYQNPLSLAQNSIRYFVSGGQHVVVHDMHCGEDIAPNPYRFSTIDEARIMWIVLKARIVARGYTKLV
jgi:hypothetical protein